MLDPGTEIDRYVVDEIIGEGGMAVVYKVHDKKLGRQFALKVLAFADDEVCQRMLREGKVQAALHHPNVVAVTDVIEVEEGIPGLVLEYVDGSSLDHLLNRVDLSIEQCDELALGILEGVKAAHAEGFVHRDLKPSNIMLQKHGDSVTPKVSDFGLARVKSDKSARLTATGMILGTPAYMAPEQLNDAKRIDERADIYSVGAILYELATGEQAVQANNLFEAFQIIEKGSMPKPRELRPELPERMERAILGAMRPNRDERISDVSDLIKVWKGEDEAKRSGPWDTLTFNMVGRPGETSAEPTIDVDGLDSMQKGPPTFLRNALEEAGGPQKQGGQPAKGESSAAGGLPPWVLGVGVLGIFFAGTILMLAILS